MLLKIGLALYRCFCRVLMSILCVVVHVLCLYASKLLSGFFGTRSGIFGEGRLATLLPRLARFDLANRGVRKPVKVHTYARLFVFDETLAQPHFAVVNCSDAVMSVLKIFCVCHWRETMLPLKSGFIWTSVYWNEILPDVASHVTWHNPWRAHTTLRNEKRSDFTRCAWH